MRDRLKTFYSLSLITIGAFNLMTAECVLVLSVMIFQYLLVLLFTDADNNDDADGFSSQLYAPPRVEIENGANSGHCSGCAGSKAQLYVYT